MDLLIHTNGQTTTLEIKNQLRELDYFANQGEVHETVEAIYTADDNDTYKYDRNVVSLGYNTYSFSQTFLDANPEYSRAAKMKNNTETNDFPTTPPLYHSDGVLLPECKTLDGKSLLSQLTPTKPLHAGAGAFAEPSNNILTENPVNQRDPLFVFYTENHAKKSATEPLNWVVYHKNGNNEIHIFAKHLSRDSVRSRYASIMKVKIQDVRASKFQNY